MNVRNLDDPDRFGVMSQNRFHGKRPVIGPHDCNDSAPGVVADKADEIARDFLPPGRRLIVEGIVKFYVFGLC